MEVSAACDRCLERTRYPLGASFDLYYRPVETIAREEEVGIDEAESEIGFEEGGASSWKMFSASRFCVLPMQRICSDACKGICPMCGQNRNQAACNCKMDDAADRWGALRNLEFP